MKSKGPALKHAEGSASGVTLFEMMLVIAVLAILISIAIPCFLGMQNEARKEKALGGARILKMAIESYYRNYDDTYPPGAGTATWESYLIGADPQIISDIICDPLSADGASQYGYGLSPNTSCFIIYSAGSSGTGAASIDDSGQVLVTGDAIWESSSFMEGH